MSPDGGPADPRHHTQGPLAVFENQERARLLPLEMERFDPPHWGKCKVHPDHHISFLKALYSVPTRYIGKTMWVRGDSAPIPINPAPTFRSSRMIPTSGGNPHYPSLCDEDIVNGGRYAQYRMYSSRPGGRWVMVVRIGGSSL